MDEEPEEPEPVVDFEGVDVFGLEDVCDIGAKMPLFRDFQNEDYALMSLRAEMHFLAHSFGKDVDDSDRTAMHLDHLVFYYQKYLSKNLNAQTYGVQTPLELLQLIRDTIYVQEKNHAIESLIPADLETHAVFIKLTEEARRQRFLALEMGDETAKLKIQSQGHQNLNNHNQNAQKQGEKRQWEGGQGEKRQWEGGKGKQGKYGKFGGWGRW